jgi:hypothetical protein
MTAARPFLRRASVQQHRGERIEIDGPGFAGNHGAADAGSLPSDTPLGSKARVIEVIS